MGESIFLGIGVGSQREIRQKWKIPLSDYKNCIDLLSTHTDSTRHQYLNTSVV